MVKSANTLDYIRAEFYKVLHRKYTWGFLLAMLAGAGLLVAGWAFTNANGNDVGFYVGAGIMTQMLIVGLYCTILTGDVVFSDQYKFNTLKNEVSYGIPRVRIYLGKLLVSAVTAIVLCAIIIGFYLALCWAVLPHTPEMDGAMMEVVGFSLLSALPLWLGAQALSMLCLAFFKSSTVASFAYVGIIMGVPEVFKLLGMLIDPVFIRARDFLLSTPFEMQFNPGDWSFFAYCCAIGAAWLVGSTLVGLLMFQKREIN